MKKITGDVIKVLAPQDVRDKFCAMGSEQTKRSKRRKAT